MKTKIAETIVAIRSPGGKTTPIHIAIGRPYRVSDGEAACPISMRGLYPKLPDLRGVDTFQALAIAYQFVRQTILAWEEKGHTFHFPDGRRLPLDIWFGKTKDNSKPKPRTTPRNLRLVPRRK